MSKHHPRSLPPKTFPPPLAPLPDAPLTHSEELAQEARMELHHDRLRFERASGERDGRYEYYREDR